jgi:hypothetical protein
MENLDIISRGKYSVTEYMRKDGHLDAISQSVFEILPQIAESDFLVLKLIEDNYRPYIRDVIIVTNDIKLARKARNLLKGRKVMVHTMDPLIYLLNRTLAFNNEDIFLIEDPGSVKWTEDHIISKNEFSLMVLEDKIDQDLFRMCYKHSVEGGLGRVHFPKYPLGIKSVTCNRFDPVSLMDHLNRPDFLIPSERKRKKTVAITDGLAEDRERSQIRDDRNVPNWAELSATGDEPMLDPDPAIDDLLKRFKKLRNE